MNDSYFVIIIIILFLNSLLWHGLQRVGTRSLGQCCPIILLELCPLSPKDFLVYLWTRVSALRLWEPSVSWAHQKQITHESNDWKNGKQLPWKHLQDMIFCSSKEMSSLCQTHCWAEKGGSVGHPEGQEPRSSGWGLPGTVARRSSLKVKWKWRCTPSPLWELWACSSPPLLPCQLPPVPARWQRGQEAQLESHAVAWSSKATAWGLYEIGALETVTHPRSRQIVCVCVYVCPHFPLCLVEFP